MKGAIGNAFILNMVITFMLIFLLLVVGSMAYTKAYKVKNYLLTELSEHVDNKIKTTNNFPMLRSSVDREEWYDKVNEYLAKSGYPLATGSNRCPRKEGYNTIMNTKTGQYEYCIYQNTSVPDLESSVKAYSTYMVLVYMKLDFPVFGGYIKLPITGETKTFAIPK